MADCPSQGLDLGRKLSVEWVSGCGSDSPLSTATTPLDFKPLGYTTTKSINRTMRVVDATNDTSGAVMDEVTIGYGVEIPVSVFVAKDVADVSTHEELQDYILDEIDAGRQPTTWIKITDLQKGKYFYYFCAAGDFSESAESEGLITGDFNFKLRATNSPTNAARQTETIT